MERDQEERKMDNGVLEMLILFKPIFQKSYLDNLQILVSSNKKEFIQEIKCMIYEWSILVMENLVLGRYMDPQNLLKFQ
jgi:hypothetical protein